MRLLLLAVPLLLATACSERFAQATPAEQVLIDQMTRDRFVVVIGTWRDEEGRLVVDTRQGGRQRAYVLAPEVDGAKDPLIRRRIDEFELATIPPQADQAPILQRGRGR